MPPSVPEHKVDTRIKSPTCSQTQSVQYRDAIFLQTTAMHSLTLRRVSLPSALLHVHAAREVAFSHCAPDRDHPGGRIATRLYPRGSWPPGSPGSRSYCALLSQP